MKRNKKRQAELKAKTQSSSLEFQTMWGARQKMTEVNAEVEGRIREELQVLNNMGVAGDMLTLKTLLDDIQLTMGASAEHSRGILPGTGTHQPLRDRRRTRPAGIPSAPPTHGQLRQRNQKPSGGPPEKQGLQRDNLPGATPAETPQHQCGNPKSSEGLRAFHSPQRDKKQNNQP